MAEKCEACGRVKADDFLTWNRAEHARFMAAPDDADSPEELGPAETCARLCFEGPGKPQVSQWDCDRATIARLQAENERIKARLVGVLDYSRSLAAASAENADRLERELAAAKGRVAELEEHGGDLLWALEIGNAAECGMFRATEEWLRALLATHPAL